MKTLPWALGLCDGHFQTFSIQIFLYSENHYLLSQTVITFLEVYLLHACMPLKETEREVLGMTGNWCCLSLYLDPQRRNRFC